MKAIKLVFFLFIGFLSSCNQNEVYFKYKSAPEKGWNKDTLLTFKFDMVDTLSRYDVFIHVRNTTNYPYQNFWLFLENSTPDSVVARDTIECYLADEYGKWIGTGKAVREIPIFYKHQIVFPDSGTYQMKIGHGMRDTLLVGIKEIGLRIEKVEQ